MVRGSVTLGLRAKLTLLMAASLTIVGFSQAMLQFRDSRALLRAQLGRRAQSMARSLAASARLGLLSDDRTALEDLGRNVLADADVVYVMFVRPDGSVVARTANAPEQFDLVHGRAGDAMRTEVRSWREGRVYQVVAPVLVAHIPHTQSGESALFALDAPTSTDAPAVVEAAGFVALGLSFHETDRATRDALLRATGLGSAVAALGLVVAAIVAGLTTRRLRAAIGVTKRMATGDLSQRIHATDAGDEINALAVHFNRMAEELGRQRDEITRANAELRARLDLEQRNAELTAENAAILKSSQLKSQFLATMSHELRTPMNAIIGFTRLVLKKSGDVLPERQRDNLRKVDEAAGNLLVIINDILDLSKVEAGRMHVALEQVDLAALVHERVEGLMPLAAAKSLALEAHVDADVPIVQSDPNRLRQVITNLVSNALKFTHEGHVHVTVKRAGLDGVMLEVQDTGIGIPADKIEHIFEPFYQVEGGATRTAGGTGLGLAIVREMCRLLGASVEVTSHVGKGTTFVVQLPVAARVTAMSAGSGKGDQLNVA